VHQFR